MPVVRGEIRPSGSSGFKFYRSIQITKYFLIDRDTKLIGIILFDVVRYKSELTTEIIQGIFYFIGNIIVDIEIRMTIRIEYAGCSKVRFKHRFEQWEILIFQISYLSVFSLYITPASPVIRWIIGQPKVVIDWPDNIVQGTVSLTY